MGRLLHLVGSEEGELMADLSRLYARDCLDTLDAPDRERSLIAYVTADRRWRFPDDLGDAAIAQAPSVTLPDALQRIAGEDVSAAVPQMFCRPGMTTYRALLDALQIPYLGNRPEVMALGLDKARCRAVVAGAGVAVPAGRVVGARDELTAAPPPPLPAVVKPVDGDNSVGTTLVREAGELGDAVKAALAHSDAALIERYVEPGREVRCGLLQRDGELVGLPLEEYAVDPVTKPIRGAADKLARTAGGELTLVAKDAAHAWIVDPDDPVCPAVWEAARRCHRALGCRHYSLFDFRIDPAGRPWFLEAGLYCSFARQSVLATMARAAGIDTPRLFADVLALALHRSPTERSLS